MTITPMFRSNVKEKAKITARLESPKIQLLDRNSFQNIKLETVKEKVKLPDLVQKNSQNEEKNLK